jgi:hypothetical protein
MSFPLTTEPFVPSEASNISGEYDADGTDGCGVFFLAIFSHSSETNSSAEIATELLRMILTTPTFRE